MHFQKSLPRLPIPRLDETCAKYLRALEPTMKPEELANTTKLVKDFEVGRGKGLHEQLLDVDRSNKGTSYICKPWSEMYLSSRLPVSLNFNPFLAWRRDSRPEYNDQLIRATNMVTTSLRFRRSLFENVLEPMVYHLNAAKSDSPFYRDVMRFLPESIAWYGSFLFKAYPLDMSQFRNLFHTSRIPKIGKDQLLYEPNARHMAVLRKGNFYIFDILDENGDIISPQAVHSNLSAIMNRTDPPAANPLGPLTTLDRNTWAKARHALEQAGNVKQLYEVDTAMMLLVLDEETFDAEGKDRITTAHHFLHGPAQNRWFDKSFSLIVTKDGSACVNFEHSWGDGVAVLRYFNEVYTDTITNPRIHPGDGVRAGLSTVRKLEFKVDSGVEATIKEATSSYDKLRSSLTLSPVEHEGVTKEFIKKQRLSPDSIFQLSFQLGFYKQNGYTPVTYESCSTSAFKHGRTETIRPATMATKKCVEAICSGKSTPADIRAMIDECSKVHNQLTKEAALGKGFDRHLFALKNLQVQNNEELHDIFTDPVYGKANNFTLSTSTLHGEAFVAGGFAPVIKDGYGVGYGMPEKNFGTLISSYTPHTNGEDLARCLKDGLDQIVEILSRQK